MSLELEHPDLVLSVTYPVHASRLGPSTTHLHHHTSTINPNSTATMIKSNDTKAVLHNHSTIMNTTALNRCEEARKMWLTATTLEDMDQVELLYREALNSKQQQTKSKQRRGGEPLKKKFKKSLAYAELKPEDYRKAGEKLSLLYCQSGRTQKAKKGLEYLGFVCRLAKNVLDYPLTSSSGKPAKKHNKKKHQHPSSSVKSSPSGAEPPCVIYDNFLHSQEIQQLKLVFENPTASYWISHKYQVEPPSPYFSYVMPLKHRQKEVGYTSSSFVEHIVQKIWKLPELNEKFPELPKATAVEMWAHNRPHASGHQMHFDSDDEGRGGVRNPIVSTILYITADGGGPSLVTNQRLDSTYLADKGWLAHPKPKRLVAFDGRVLHGVVPGKGMPPNKGGRRVTLMFAFWKKIQVRKESTPGSARPFPTKSKLEWVKGLKDESISKDKQKNTKTLQAQQPIELDAVYETLDGNPWNPKDGMLDYEQVFQGF